MAQFDVHRNPNAASAKAIPFLLDVQADLLSGLVTRVAADPHLAAGELIDEILTRSPDSVAATKRIFEDTWPGRTRHTFARERIEQARLLMATNTKIVRAAGAARTLPEFAARPRSRR